jgi:hypothetical protein
MVYVSCPENLFFLNELGDLHDCRIEDFRWSIRKKSVELQFEDLRINFEGLAGDRGPAGGVVILTGVEKFSANICWSEKSLRVMEFLVELASDGLYRASVHLIPSGKLEILFSEATYPIDILSEPQQA